MRNNLPGLPASSLNSDRVKIIACCAASQDHTGELRPISAEDDSDSTRSQIAL
jgi:hypothetical protein